MKVYWVGRDLRVHDNAALFEAASFGEGVVAVYTLCLSALRRHHVGQRQMQWLWLHLNAMQDELARLNIPLKVVTVNQWQQTAKVLVDFCSKNHVDGLYCNRRYEYDERRCEEQLSQLCASQNIRFEAFHDQTLLIPGTVMTGKGTCYTVFTPFKKAARAFWGREGLPPVYGLPKKQPASKISSSRLAKHMAGVDVEIDSALWPVGESAARQRLRYFCRHHVSGYQEARDFPALDSTSRLSAYLAIGVLSPRTCLHELLQATEKTSVAGLNQGAQIWLDELLWRDFYKHVLIYFPHVCQDLPFDLSYRSLRWGNSSARFKAWQEGQTGFPLVDAAMRQLNNTGWMHNRLRMVVAMFLSKNCHVDWRWGEQYFSEQLIDYDFSSNNGGWQWSASTGTDAAPYFRIFNPISQSERFDAEGKFIKQYCPELAALNSKDIHCPGSARPTGYPAPIVDHKQTRLESIEMYKKQRISKG
jgi:deoxyribodipyrimidine photo-lyase